MTNIAMDNHHRNSGFSVENSESFHRYVSHYQRVNGLRENSPSGRLGDGNSHENYQVSLAMLDVQKQIDTYY